MHLTLRNSAISCAPGVQRTCTPSALPVYFSSDSTVRLNPRRGHQTGSGEPSAGG